MQKQVNKKSRENTFFLENIYKHCVEHTHTDERMVEWTRTTVVDVR